MDRATAILLLTRLDVLKAFADGKTIQHKGLNTEWGDVVFPSLDLVHYQYRIKPPEPLVWYTAVDARGKIFMGVYATKAERENALKYYDHIDNRRSITLKEVDAEE